MHDLDYRHPVKQSPTKLWLPALGSGCSTFILGRVAGQGSGDIILWTFASLEYGTRRTLYQTPFTLRMKAEG